MPLVTGVTLCILQLGNAAIKPLRFSTLFVCGPPQVSSSPPSKSAGSDNCKIKLNFLGDSTAADIS